MAEMFKIMGGGGGGGVPNLESLMNNPQFMAMAQQMMANGGLEQLLKNPAVNNMVCFIRLVEYQFMFNIGSADESRAIR